MSTSVSDTSGAQWHAVSPKEDCPHLENIDFGQVYDTLTSDFLNAPCKECDNTSENWYCLGCREIHCSRYVNGHMALHNQEEEHPVALSFSDASFWCYSCESYVTSKDLRTIGKRLGQVKFPELNDPNQLAKDLEKLNLQVKDEKKQFSKEELIAGLKNKKFKKICFMTGAGISVAAGIPDFRTPGTGLYSKVEKLGLPFPEAIFSLDHLREKPEAFFSIAKDFLSYKVKPVKAHQFIKKIFDEEMLLMSFTQNIDGLEYEAGVPLEKIVEAHGHMRDAHCIKCKKQYALEDFNKHVEDGTVFKCGCGGIIKPDIVFFGEELPAKFHENFLKIKDADLVFVMGTSLKVFPFASLLPIVPKQCPLVLVNRENPGVKRENFLFLEGDIEKSIEDLTKEIGWEPKSDEKKED